MTEVIQNHNNTQRKGEQNNVSQYRNYDVHSQKAVARTRNYGRGSPELGRGSGTCLTELERRKQAYLHR